MASTGFVLQAIFALLALDAAAASFPTNRCILDTMLAKSARSEQARNVSSHSDLPKGPYSVKTGTISKIPGLSLGGPYSAYIIYAEPKTNGEKFPFISFAHGTTAGGSKTLTDYTTDLETVASYGFVIVAAESCPEIECFSGYCKDQQQTIRACKSDPSLHPALSNADFSTVGVFGHSMGAMATIGSAGGSRACKYDESLNIKAAVAQHACSDFFMQASPVEVPIMFTAGSVDTICEDGCSSKFYDQVTKAPSKIIFDVKGANHFEPTNIGSNSEVPAVAYFLACWLRNEQCDKVYGSSGKEICNQMPFGSSLHACEVSGSKAVSVAAPSPPAPPSPPASFPTNRCLLDTMLAKSARSGQTRNASSLSDLPKGPYSVKTGTISKIPGLSLGGPYSAYIIYAEPKTNGEKFPFISFAHGTTAGGSKLLPEYATDLELVASYGFVIVAAESCPEIECSSRYCVDQQQTIRACKSDPSLHPALASADFSNVGVFGHSMGAMATIGSAGGSKSCKYDESLNIKAAVAQHACSDAFMQASPVEVPIMFTAGSVDTICEDGCSAKFYDQVTQAPSKIIFDVKGANHFEPTYLGSNSEVPAVAHFLSCWLRNEQCDKVYGSSGKEICNQMPSGSSLHACEVSGSKAVTLVV